MIINNTPNIICRGADTLTYTHIFSRYSGISSHSFGRTCGSMGVVAVRRQRAGRKHGGGVGSAAAAALAARRRQPAWWLRRKFGGIAASAAAAERWELRCCRAPPRWRRKHQQWQQWRGNYQQSTINLKRQRQWRWKQQQQ
jgi:hypothetical protein